MKSADKLATLKQKEKDLQSEINQLLKDLKTETGELMASLLEHTGLLEENHNILAGLVLEMKSSLDKDEKRREQLSKQGSEFIKAMKTKRSRKKSSREE